jgi:HEAT repeat protein
MTDFPRMVPVRPCLLVLLAVLLPGVQDLAAVPQRTRPAAPAQRPAAQTSPGAEEAREIAAGWGLIAQGLSGEASTRATRLLAAYPRSAAALAFAVEADLLGGGAAKGLDRYERWLGTRTFEEPLVVRRIARAVLQEALAQQTDPTARVEAWRALTAHGEPAGPKPVASQGTRAGGATVRALAAAGDEQAVRTLLSSLQAGSVDHARTLDALGASGSPLGVGLIVQFLQDERQEVRASAVDALGKTGGEAAVPQLKAMLADRSLFVRAKAAGSLLRLGDQSGMPVVEALAADPVPSIRLLAAEAMANRQGAPWLDLARELTASDDPEVRIAAARLVAPHDSELSRNVLDAFAGDPNPALRDLAAASYGESVEGYDLTTLRRLLKQPAVLTKVRAAAQILDLLR